jgi:putative immunity protein/bacteriocin
MKKTVLSILSALLLILPTVSSAQSEAADPAATTSSCGCSSEDGGKEETLKKLQEAGVTVSEIVSSGDIQAAEKIVASNKVLKDSLKTLYGKGYKEVRKKYISFNNLNMLGYHFEKLVVVGASLQDKKGDVAYYGAYVDTVSNKVIKYASGYIELDDEARKVSKQEISPAVNFDAESHLKNNVLVSYQIKNKKLDKGTVTTLIDKDGIICDLVGVYTCMTYCWAFSFFAPVIGTVICDLTCGLTWVVVCNL